MTSDDCTEVVPRRSAAQRGLARAIRPTPSEPTVIEASGRGRDGRWLGVGGTRRPRVVCRVKAVVRRVLARRMQARERSEVSRTWALCELAVNTRGGPHIGARPRVRGPRRARGGCRAVHRGGPARAGRQAAVEKPAAPPPREPATDPRTRPPPPVGSFLERVSLRMMVHEFECAQYGAPCINS